MKQEDEELLLKDLCGRLPYGVKIHKVLYDAVTLTERDIEYFRRGLNDILIPYLRPMSSMTDEERTERISILYELEGHIEEDVTYKYQDWLNAHHLDYRGLIHKGLAIEAPKGMYI